MILSLSETESHVAHVDLKLYVTVAEDNLELLSSCIWDYRHTPLSSVYEMLRTEPRTFCISISGMLPTKLYTLSVCLLLFLPDRTFYCDAQAQLESLGSINPPASAPK